MDMNIRKFVMLLDITDAENEQYSFYEYENYDQSDSVMKTLDGVNARYGSSALTLGAQGVKKDWKMKSKKSLVPTQQTCFKYQL